MLLIVAALLNRASTGTPPPDPVVEVPVNSAAPVITGTVQVGQSLSASTGVWSNDPTSYAYQWALDSVPVSGATNNIFGIIPDYIGKVVTVTVTATNSAGSASRVSAGTALVADTAPTTAPTVTATALSDTSVSVSFTSVTRATSYQYRYSSNGGSTWSTVTAATSPFPLTGLTPSTTYVVQVRASNSGGAGPFSTSASVTTQAPAAITSSALQFNGIDTIVRHNDSVNWSLPDADWTFGVFASITSNAGTAAQYFFSSGSYAVVNAWNFLVYEDSNTNTKEYEFVVRDGGASAFIYFGAEGSGLTDDEWRLWTVERVKAIETINIYYTPVNGTRVLYNSGTCAGLGAVDSTVNPGIGTRVAPLAGGPNWLNGGVHSFFKMNGRLTATETAQVANGKDLITDLGKSPLIYTKFTTTTSPITDRGSAGNNGVLSGAFTLTDGPTFTV